MENEADCSRILSRSEIMPRTSFLLFSKCIDVTFHLHHYWNYYMTILILAVICSLIYYTLFLPTIRIRVLEDVGYYHLDTSKYKNRKTKAELVNEVLRRKELGDLPPVYPNGWYSLLESSDIKAGQVKHIQALGENFAVIRTSTGKVHVLDAYCPHLGANMAVGGVVRGDCLECPFHGWQFCGEDGTCSQIPYSDKGKRVVDVNYYCPYQEPNMIVGGVVKRDCLECPVHGWQFCGEDGTCSQIPYSNKVPKSARVKTWYSSEVNRSIYVWYHAEEEPPSWHMERIPQIENGWNAGRVEYTIQSHIQDISENAADVQHFAFVHYDGIPAGGDAWRSSSWLSRVIMQQVCKVQWEKNLDSGHEHKSSGRVFATIKLFEKFELFQSSPTYEQVGPGFYSSEICPMYFAISITPVEPLLQKVRINSYAPIMLIPLTKMTLILGVAWAVERDMLIWSHKKYLSKPLLCQEEESLRKHRRWFKQFYSPNSPKHPLKQIPLEW